MSRPASHRNQKSDFPFVVLLGRREDVALRDPFGDYFVQLESRFHSFKKDGCEAFFCLLTDCNHNPASVVIGLHHRQSFFVVMVFGDVFPVPIFGCGRYGRGFWRFFISRAAPPSLIGRIWSTICAGTAIPCRAHSSQKRILRQLHGTDFTPRRRLVELRVGMNPSCMGFVFRLPRAAAGFFQARHRQKMMSGFSGRSWSSYSKAVTRIIFASG